MTDAARKHRRDRIEHRDIVVNEVPGYRPLTVDLVVPVEASGPVPVLVWIHGGAWLFGSPKQPAGWLMEVDPFTAAIEAGFAVASAQYRLSGEAPFPAQLDDVKAAVRWLRRHGDQVSVDRERIGVWGESAGGHLASMLALTGKNQDDSRVAAAVCWYAPSNLLTMQSQAHPSATIDHDAADSPESLLIGAALTEHPELGRAASPVTYVTAQAPPMLLVHGDQDVVVPVGQSEELATALGAVGAEVELSVVPGADHCFGGVPLEPVVRDSLAFFARVLAPGPAANRGESMGA
ncbi:alpha/beta hydrolase [Micromonospora sp. LAH09]|uniref:alpha/beta hydrolase n=1 Tax=Micromonospora cabrerizensis TaxID=2911213 RepID=UPI001EE91F75|nr:alpha/beta hydrolase [Micromonospora cabrerizensis]MCG5468134.1 alpha/beta hydrolase [Micromonospora cabrerizensis]